MINEHTETRTPQKIKKKKKTTWKHPEILWRMNTQRYTPHTQKKNCMKTTQREQTPESRKTKDIKLDMRVAQSSKARSINATHTEDFYHREISSHKKKNQRKSIPKKKKECKGLGKKKRKRDKKEPSKYSLHPW
jgi:hypothetical protein